MLLVDRAAAEEVSGLHAASRAGCVAAVAALLTAAGTDVNQKNRCGQTPLWVAAENGHEAVVERLLAAGAAVNHASSNGCTPLGVAAQQGHEAVVAQLLAAGAAVDLAGTVAERGLRKEEGQASGYTLADGRNVDFSGSWGKDKERSEDYATFETALGQPMWVTMSLTGMPMRKVIEHRGLEWTNHSIVGIYLTTKVSTLNNVAEAEKHPFDAKVTASVTSTLREEDGDVAVVSVSTFTGSATAGVHTVTRTLEDGGETMRLHEVLVPPTGSGKRTLTATLYYKRLHDDLGLAGTTAPPCAQS